MRICRRARSARSAFAPPRTSRAIAAIRRRPRELFTDDGNVRTGDIGYLDEDGYLFIVDRKKEIIIRGGENISAAEVEAELYACPAVAEAAVFGAPDERLGEVPVAVISSEDGATLTEDELRAFLDGRLAKFKIPAAHHRLDRTVAAPRHRQDRPPRAEGAVRAIERSIAGRC